MQNYTIKNRHTGAPIYAGEAESLRALVERGVSEGVDFAGAYLAGADLKLADLRGADFTVADLRGADLAGADFRGAILRRADFTGTDLRGVDFWGTDLTRADLTGAYFTGAWLRWSSHDLLAEILRQAAGDDPARRQIAGLVLISRDWCWKDFLALDHPEKDWALDELAKWVQEGDGAPEEIRARAKAMRGAA